MTFKLNPAIFREYDIRGIADEDLTEEFAEQLGFAYATYFRKNTYPQSKPSRIVVGQDCRLTSEKLATALVSGLRKGGMNVIRTGVCTTPITYFSICYYELAGGIMITGSHNPAEYNGFKICLGRDTIHGDQIQALKKIVEKQISEEVDLKETEFRGQLETRSVIPTYLDYLKKNCTGVKPKKVVIDAGNGTASIIAPELFKRLGAQVIPLFCEMDGNFPNHHPDPTVHANLKDLVETVKKEKADFGIAFDGDSDRIGFVDETGRIFFGDELMVVLARDVLSRLPGATIISEVKSSHRLYDDIRNHGGKGIMWKTGHSLIKSKMKETKAALAGEMSGHIFFADRYYGYDDAIYAAMRIYEIISRSDKPASQLIADLPKIEATPEIRLDCQESLKFLLVNETKKKLADHHKVTDIDGVRVDFGDGWGLIRASNTQPVLVLRFEATTPSRLKEIREIMETALKECAQEIGHPPIE